MRPRRASALLLAVVLALVVPAAGAEPPPLEHDPQDVRQLADEILERDEFQPPQRSILQRIGDWLQDLLGGDSGDGGGSGSSAEAGGAGAGGSSVFTVVLFVLAVVAVGYVVLVLLRHPRRRRVIGDDDLAVELEAHRTARQWAADAQRFEAEGRWKDGLRCRFRALVEELVDERVVPELAGRTSGELRLDVRAAVPAAADRFDEAATLFERAWYGDLPTGPEEAGRFAASAEAVLAEAARPVSRPEPAGVGA